MTDELCDKCGIGFFLPSGRCDHCNCVAELASVRAQLTPEEKATHARWEREAGIKELERAIKARDSKALEAAIKAKHPAADFAEKQTDLIDSVRTTPGERSFQARRRGAIQALRALGQWALDQREGCDVEGFTAYTEVSEHCLTLIEKYNDGREAFGDEKV